MDVIFGMERGKFPAANPRPILRPDEFGQKYASFWPIFGIILKYNTKYKKL
jgi:hypothetical protein